MPGAVSADLLVAWTPSEGTRLQVASALEPALSLFSLRVLPGDIRTLIHSYSAGTRESVSLSMRGRGPEVREETSVNVLPEGLIVA